MLRIAMPRRDALLKKFSAASRENARIAQEDIFGIENTLKAIKGYNTGLIDKALMAKKAADENKMREAVASDPKKKAEFGDPGRKSPRPWTPKSRSICRSPISSGAPDSAAIWPGIARALVRAADGTRQAQWRALARIPRFRSAFARAGPVLHRADLQIARQSASSPIRWPKHEEKMPGDPAC